jgi:hypothetical protein
MSRSGYFFFRVLAGVLTLAALIIGGVLIYNAGQAQGYALGLATSGEGAQLQAPAAPIYPGGAPYWGWHFGFFPFSPFFGLFCFGGLILLLFFAIGGIFRPMHWRHHPGGHYPGYWQGWKEGPPSRGGSSGSEGQPPSTDTGDQPLSPAS